ncbi:MAG: M56 family metallopeptidase, partial [Planctomycetota bacterium]
FFHELAHVLRRDVASQFFVKVTAGVFWFHPLMWLLARQLRDDRETAADDWASSQTGDRHSYATGLLEIFAKHCTSAPLPAGSIPMASYKSPASRIQHLLSSQAVSRESVRFRGTVTMSTVAIALLLSTVGFGRQDADKHNATKQAAAKTAGKTEAVTGDLETESFEMLRVTGDVVDSNGNPIAGTKILYEGNRTVADENGHYDLEFPFIPPAQRITPMTWFYSPGMAWRSAWFTNGGAAAVDEDEMGQKHLKDFRITLPPSTRMDVLVTAPDGRPVPNATVVPACVHVPNGCRVSDLPAGLVWSLPKELEELIQRRTGADGRAVLEHIPEGLVYSLRIESEEYGQQTFQLATMGDGSKVQTALRPVASISGQVDGDVSAFAGATVRATSETRLGGRRIVSSEAKATVQRDGRFAISKIAALDELKFEVFGSPLGQEDIAPVLKWDGSLSAERTLKVKLRGVPLRRLDGTLLTEDSQEPIPNSRVSIRSSTSPRYSSALTDKQGRFSAKVPDGDVTLQATAVTGTIGQRYDHRIQPNAIKVNGASVKYTFVLRPKHQLSGRLVDPSGTPIGDAFIGLRNMGVGIPPGSLQHRTTTDGDGQFTMLIDFVALSWVRTGARRDRKHWFMQTRPQEGVRPAELTPLDATFESGNRVLLRVPEVAPSG